MASDLDREVSRAAKTIEPQSLAWLHIAKAERAIANDPRTQQGRGFHVSGSLRKRIGKILRDDHRFCIATVDVQPREPGIPAQVLQTALTKGTVATGAVEPRHAYAFAEFKTVSSWSSSRNPANDLVTRDNRQDWKIEIPFDGVQIGMTDAAGEHIQAHLSRPRFRVRDLGEAQWMVTDGIGLPQHHSLHLVLRSSGRQ
jgi:hypothetical protein